MNKIWLVAFAAMALGGVETAEACACCDAKFSRKPIGWSADGALLIDTADTHACELKKRLEVWPVDANEPTQCYDLYGDPETPIACADITSAAPKDKPKKTSVAAKKTFSKAPARFAGTKFRVRQAWAEADSSTGGLDVTVELKTKAGWQSAWKGTIHPVRSPHQIKLDVSLWPDRKGEKAALFVGYFMSGTNNQVVDVHWVTLAK